MSLRRKNEPQGEIEQKSKYGVAAEQFIKIWEDSDSVKEVADKTGMPAAVCSARAKSYRDLGIPLKQMPRIRRKSLDVKALTDMVVARRVERGLPPPDRRGENAEEASCSGGYRKADSECDEGNIRTGFRKVKMGGFGSLLFALDK